MGVNFSAIKQGEVETLLPLSSAQLVYFQEVLLNIGLELINDKKSIIVERIKIAIASRVRDGNASEKTNLSTYLAQKTGTGYAYLSAVFSSDQGCTIEQYIIATKIEQVKELIKLDKLNLTEIAMILAYSSPGHMSFQFKKTTGLTPSQYKKNSKLTSVD